MTISDSERLKQIVEDLTSRPAAQVALESWPTQYGLDSLSLLVFREQCERTFAVMISDEEWAEMQDLRDILTLVCNRQIRPKQSSSLYFASAEAAQSAVAVPCHPDDMVEDLEIGMPLTGINRLSENGLLKYLGDLRWRHLARISGVPSCDLVDDAGQRLYPTFFYVESSFPPTCPMAHFGENDRFHVIDSVRRFGSSMLDGVSYLIPSDRSEAMAEPIDSFDQAAALRVPVVRMANIFVMKFNGAEWLKKGRPQDRLISGVRELADPPDCYSIAKRAEADGCIDTPDLEVDVQPLQQNEVEYRYAVQPDRDVNGVGLLYFANYLLFLDLAERTALQRAEDWWPDEAINGRTLVNRKLVYLNNASWRDESES